MDTKRAKTFSIRGFALAFFTITATLSLMAMLLSAGFAVCTLKPVSQVMSFAFCNDEQSPYLKEDLVDLAVATQDYTLNDSLRSSLGLEAARKNICALTLQSAKRAIDVNAPTKSRWSSSAIKVIEDSAGESPITVNDNLAKISQRYALDEAAFDHLDDCYRVISAIESVLLGASVAFIASLGLLAAMQRRLAAKALLLAPCILMATLVICGTWAFLDFASFFETFHRILFFQSTQGSWVFPYDSLLISMLPTPFWIGMGAIWALVSSLACVACILVGKRIASRK